jgi:branched-chain amino acid aminotransferase
MTDIQVQLTGSPRPRPPENALGFGKYFTDHMFVAEWAPGKEWHGARVVPYGPFSLDPAAGVFHYGQAMFDGMKAFRAASGKVNLFRLDRHSQRMHRGAPRLSMPAPPAQLVADGITAVVRADRDWVPSALGTALYVRPTLIATEPFLGVRPAERYTLFVILSPVGGYYGDGGLKPVKIHVEDRYTRAAPGGLGGVKAGANYAASLYAAEVARKHGFAQVLWLDAAAHKTFEEVGTMNLFVRLGDELCTPPLKDTILEGVTRDCVLTLARGWGLRVSERAITIDEVLAAQRSGSLKEVFGCGTAAVISPVGELSYAGERIVIGGGAVGEVAHRLYDEITGIQYGTRPDPAGWLTEVV